MANEFDPYREALVLERVTFWPDEFDDLESSFKEHVAERLHAEPAQATELSYLRTHTGFARQITVTPQDLERVT